MTDDPALVRRGTDILRPDPRRVISKMLVPGQEILTTGNSGAVVRGSLLPGQSLGNPRTSRAGAVINRVLDMSETAVSDTLAATLERFAGRHRDLPATFEEHFKLVEHRLPDDLHLSPERRALIGAYCTQEYAVEAAALFNPSVVAHPDQTGLARGELRFIMSLRAVGEGHLSSVEFRTGVLRGPDSVHLDAVEFDAPGPFLVTGQAAPASMSRAFLRAAMAGRADAAGAEPILDRLPARCAAADLDAALASLDDGPARTSAATAARTMAEILSRNYELHFPEDLPLSEMLLHPTTSDESHGIEDTRFTRFTDDDGTISYYATYTAFDGALVNPRLLHTVDFRTFESRQLTGPAAQNKGMALFPRRVDGRFLALSRWDRESIGIAASEDAEVWGDVTTVEKPERPWELVQIGNCGPPIETAAGWLVLTHGVGPMRQYSIGAVLLDLADPTVLLGALPGPLLTADRDERDGYVPNVVYSCGALLHAGTLLLPYGCSDVAVRLAFVDLAELLRRLVG